MDSSLNDAITAGYFRLTDQNVEAATEYGRFCNVNGRVSVVLNEKKKYTYITFNLQTAKAQSTRKIVLKPEVLEELNDILDRYVELDYRNREKVNKFEANQTSFVIENLTKDVVYDFLAEILPILFSGWEERG